MATPAVPVRPSRGASSELLRMVCFRLAGQRFAIPVAAVAEVIPQRPVTRVPFTPRAVAGIINLRGDVVSVLDLGELLGLGKTTIGESTCIVIVRAAGRTGGVLCDRIDEMKSFDPEKLEPKPPVGSARTAAFVAGVVTLKAGPTGVPGPPGGPNAAPEEEPGAPCSVLDMEAVFASPELVSAEPS